MWLWWLQNDVPGLLTLLNADNEAAAGSVHGEITAYGTAQDSHEDSGAAQEVTQDMVNRYYNVRGRTHHALHVPPYTVCSEHINITCLHQAWPQGYTVVTLLLTNSVLHVFVCVPGPLYPHAACHRFLRVRLGR